MMWRIFLTDCGYGMRPPSVPITWKASPVDRPYSYDRDTDAFRIRNRYLRRLTFMAGQGTPFTMITSPYMPDSSLLSNRNSPVFVNIASEMISGTSNSPLGS